MSATKYYAFNGEQLSLRDIAERTGLELETIRFRVKLGWSMQRIVSTRRDRSLPSAAAEQAAVLASIEDEEPLTYAEALIFVLARQGWHEQRIQYAIREAAAFERELRKVEPQTLEAIGEQWGITREGVRKFEECAKRKLRHCAPLATAWREHEG